MTFKRKYILPLNEYHNRERADYRLNHGLNMHLGTRFMPRKMYKIHDIVNI